MVAIPSRDLVIACLTPSMSPIRSEEILYRVISHNSKLRIARRDATPECADCNLRPGLGHMRLSSCSYQSELLREIRISLLGICRRPNDPFRPYPAFMGPC